MTQDSLHSKIKMVQSQNFEALAYEVFLYQFECNALYRDWCKRLNKTPRKVKEICQIPYLPISFFKTRHVLSGEWNHETTFESSGTSGAQSSQHHIFSVQAYHENCVKAFEEIFGEISEYVILALLPSYLERGNSGLVEMVNHFIEQTAHPDSGFYLNNYQGLSEKLHQLKASGQKVMLWGVTFALLDFAESFPMHFAELSVMETGGMKGRRKEMVRQEVHEHLRKGLGTTHIYSEYGMTELFSQAYAVNGGVFQPAKTMQVSVRDFNDPFTFLSKHKAGGINIIDLANVNTCSFIETQDIGKLHDHGYFEVLGRFDHADLRGCNLMVM